MEAPSGFDATTATLRRRVLAVGVPVALVAGALVAVLGPVVLGLVVALAVAVAWWAWVRSVAASSLPRLLSAVDAVPASAEDLPGLHNALEGVGLSAGVPVPEVYLVESPAANALCAADGDRSVVVVTRGLVDGARPLELEVIAAELVCRLKDGSAAYLTACAGVPGPLAALVGADGSAIAAVLGEQRWVQADLDALDLTRYPPALIDTLERMHATGTSVAAADAATSAMWLADAEGAGAGPGGIDDRVLVPLQRRIEVLRELTA